MPEKRYEKVVQHHEDQRVPKLAAAYFREPRGRVAVSLSFKRVLPKRPRPAARLVMRHWQKVPDRREMDLE